VAVCDHRRASTFCSGDLGFPAAVAVQILRPALAAAGEVVAMGDQPLVLLAGEQGDGVGAWVVAEELAGHANLMAAAGAEHLLIQPGPVLDRLVAGGL